MNRHRKSRTEKTFLRAGNEQADAFTAAVRFNPDGGFSFFRMNLSLFVVPTTNNISNHRCRFKPGRGFSFIQPSLCVASATHNSFTIAVSLNPDGGFSFFRTKERKSPRKKERKPCVRRKPKRRSRSEPCLFNQLVQHRAKRRFISPNPKASFNPHCRDVGIAAFR